MVLNACHSPQLLPVALPVPFELPGEKSRREAVYDHHLLPRPAFPFRLLSAPKNAAVVLSKPPRWVDCEANVSFVFGDCG
jgi:hypothetical protein